MGFAQPQGLLITRHASQQIVLCACSPRGSLRQDWNPHAPGNLECSLLLCAITACQGIMLFRELRGGSK
jgi:hypothetical protein